MSFTRAMRNAYSKANQISGTHDQVGARVLSYQPAKFAPSVPYVDYREVIAADRKAQAAPKLIISREAAELLVQWACKSRNA